MTSKSTCEFTAYCDNAKLEDTVKSVISKQSLTALTFGWSHLDSMCVNWVWVYKWAHTMRAMSLLGRHSIWRIRSRWSAVRLHLDFTARRTWSHRDLTMMSPWAHGELTVNLLTWVLTFATFDVDFLFFFVRSVDNTVYNCRIHGDRTWKKIKSSILKTNLRHQNETINSGQEMHPSRSLYFNYTRVSFGWAVKSIKMRRILHSWLHIFIKSYSDITIFWYNCRSGVSPDWFLARLMHHNR